MPQPTDLHARLTGALTEWDGDEPAIPAELPPLPIPAPRRTPEAAGRA